MKIRSEKKHSFHYYSSGIFATRLLISFLTLSAPTFSYQVESQQDLRSTAPFFPSSDSPQLTTGDSSVFTLRHVFNHGDLNQPTINKRYDIIDPDKAIWIESESGVRQQEVRNLIIKNKPIKIHRLRDRRPSVIDSIMNIARDFPQVWWSLHNSWTVDTVDAPDVTDFDTLLTLAQMSANSYLDHRDKKDWQNIHGGYNWSHSNGFGWDGDLLQGYLYADENNSTVVIALKGTSVALWDGEGTSKNDKENDNLFFSCCCGQQGYAFYRQVCNCATSRYTCNLTCLKHSMMQENHYYVAGRHLYKNISMLYPNSSIWFTGHSMGGSIGAMVGLTYGTPVVTFEAIPDALPVNRLGIPVPPGADPERPGQRVHTGVFHFGHTADPIFMGTCNGATASCSYAGYALESSCHTGKECVWDVVGQNSTRVSIFTHRIYYIINDIIKKWTEVPKCHLTTECHDCLLWREVTGNYSTPASKTSRNSKKAQNQACKKPGWWGCHDKTSTSTVISPTAICENPLQFGCNDEQIENKVKLDATSSSHDPTNSLFQQHPITPLSGESNL